jgi:hypothetical protein
MPTSGRFDLDQHGSVCTEPKFNTDRLRAPLAMDYPMALWINCNILFFVLVPQKLLASVAAPQQVLTDELYKFKADHMEVLDDFYNFYHTK